MGEVERGKGVERSGTDGGCVRRLGRGWGGGRVES